jgi:hypothetical protein
MLQTTCQVVWQDSKSMSIINCSWTQTRTVGFDEKKSESMVNGIDPSRLSNWNRTTPLRSKQLWKLTFWCTSRTWNLISFSKTRGWCKQFWSLRRQIWKIWKIRHERQEEPKAAKRTVQRRWRQSGGQGHIWLGRWRVSNNLSNQKGWKKDTSYLHRL